MRRHAIGLTILMLISVSALALGFGNITLHSTLSEPLDARFRLVAIDPEEIDALRVKLASEAAFEKAQIPRLSHLRSLEFEPRLDDSDGVFVHVTSRQSINEPFLNFLVEVTHGDDQLIREYTLLLDPPEIRPASVKRRPVARTNSSSAKAAAKSETPLRSEYVSVNSGDTLWVIAKRHRPDTSVTVEQMMMAMLKRNPDAFVHGNANLLKQGYRLYIPDMADIRSMSPHQARRAFLEQTREWKSARRSESASTEKGTDTPPRPIENEVDSLAETTATSPASSSDELNDPGAEPSEKEAKLNSGEAESAHDPRLRVVDSAPEDALSSEVVGPGSTETSSADQLRKDIEDARRDLASVRDINRDLAELTTILEEKIINLRQSIEERDKLIEALEARTKSTVADSASGTKPQKTADVAVETPKQDSASSVAEAGRSSAATDRPPAVESELIPVPPQSPDLSESPAFGSLAWLKTYWLALLVAALLLISLLIGLTILRRRREQRVHSSDEFSAFIEIEEAEEKDNRRAVNDMPLPEEGIDSESQTDEGFRLSSDEDVSSALTEADIFLAYRRYGQAESLVTDAIEKNPDSMVLKAKQLEIYAFRKDKKRFAAYMEECYADMSAKAPEIWAKVVEMGRDLIPEHQLISGIGLPEAQPDDLPEFSWSNDRDPDPK